MRKWLKFAIAIAVMVVMAAVWEQGSKAYREKSELIDASAFGDTETVKRLVERGVSVNIRWKDGWTPLTIAIVYGHTDVVEVLLRAGADVNQSEAGGNMPIFWAQYYDRKDIEQLLREYGATELAN